MNLTRIIVLLEILEYQLRQPGAVARPAPPWLDEQIADYEWAYVCGLAGGRLLALISELRRQLPEERS